MMEVLHNLDTIRNDPLATSDEKLAAHQLIGTLPYGGRPSRDQIHILNGYLQRQQAQNRYGK